MAQSCKYQHEECTRVYSISLDMQACGVNMYQTVSSVGIKTIQQESDMDSLQGGKRECANPKDARC